MGGGALTGLPAVQTGPAVWSGPDMAEHPGLWTRHLRKAEITELRDAARAFLETGRDLATLTARDFRLPVLAAALKDLRGELIGRRGFALWRGLPVGTMERKEVAAIFLGIGAHLGTARSQNARGHLLGHVRDMGADPKNPNTRIYQTHERQTFHTDSCDAVALLCLKAAREGGDSLLVSALAIFNALRAARPDLLALLMDPFATDRRGEVPEGGKPWFEIPVFSWHRERLSVIYQRQYIDSAQRFDGAPRLTAAHVEALDLFDALANDPAHHFRMRLAPGDMQFVYNHALLHDRTGFTDHAAPAERRHLLRLWLALPGDRELPPAFADRYGSLTVGARGGVSVAGMVPNVPLEP